MPSILSATTVLITTVAKSAKKKTLKSTVDDDIGSVCNLFNEATNEFEVEAPPAKVSLAMEHSKENFSEMSSDDEIITFG